MNDTKRTSLGNPLDPTRDAQQMFSDPAGMTGITDTSSKQKVLDGDDLIDQERDSAYSTGIVSVYDDQAIDKDVKSIDAMSDPDELILDSLTSMNDATPTDVLGELSISGDMPDPESDDDTLLNSHQVGLRLDEDYDNPQPLNTAADVAAAERLRRSS